MPDRVDMYALIHSLYSLLSGLMSRKTSPFKVSIVNGSFGMLKILLRLPEPVLSPYDHSRLPDSTVSGGLI